MAPDKRPLGDLLIKAGLIGPTELAQALTVQRTSGQRLGEVLVALGYLTEVDVAKAVASQLGLSFIPDHELQVDMTYAKLIPPSVARKTKALPIAEQFGKLHVAMADPLDVYSMDEIRHLTRRDIQPLACTQQGVLKAIAQYERLSALKQKDGGIEQPLPGDVNLSPEADDAPIVQLVNELIDRAIAEGASDIHIEPSEKQFRVRFRVDGFLQEIMSPLISYHPAVVARLKVLASLDISERRAPQDGRIEIRDKGRNIDLRMSTLPTVFGEKVVLRLFNKTRAVTKLEEIGFNPDIYKAYTTAVRRPYGMVLVTGPTGSGKTSTLISTLDYLNAVEKNIVTVEDPVEYQLAGVNHVQVNPRAGLGFADGLRAILRQDPNIIMVGEVRDGETADVAVRSALTGHLVLSTLHTNDAAGALTRLMDMGVEPYLIASSVVGVLAQRLLRRVCLHCREEYEVNSDCFADRGFLWHTGGPLKLYKAKGCSHCRGTGYAGRLAAFEFLQMTPAIQEMVNRRATASEIRNEAVVHGGMQILMANGLQKAAEGLTTPQEVFRVTSFSDQKPGGALFD